MVSLKRSKLFSRYRSSQPSSPSISTNDIVVLHSPTHVKPPLSMSSSLSSSPKIDSPKSKEAKCSTCSRGLSSTPVSLKCGHEFHRDCFLTLTNSQDSKCVCGAPVEISEANKPTTSNAASLRNSLVSDPSSSNDNLKEATTEQISQTQNPPKNTLDPGSSFQDITSLASSHSKLSSKPSLVSNESNKPPTFSLPPTTPIPSPINSTFSIPTTSSYTNQNQILTTPQYSNVSASPTTPFMPAVTNARIADLFNPSIDITVNRFTNTMEVNIEMPKIYDHHSQISSSVDFQTSIKNSNDQLSKTNTNHSTQRLIPQLPLGQPNRISATDVDLQISNDFMTILKMLENEHESNNSNHLKNNSEVSNSTIRGDTIDNLKAHSRTLSLTPQPTRKSFTDNKEQHEMERRLSDNTFIANTTGELSSKIDNSSKSHDSSDKLDNVSDKLDDNSDEQHDQFSNNTALSSVELSTPKLSASYFDPNPTNEINDLSYDPGLSTRDLVIKEISSKLVSIDNLFDYVDEEQIKNPLLFDYLHISTNGEDWDYVFCVLLETKFLMIDNDKLVGQLSIDEMVKLVKNIDGSLTILTNTDTLPELQVNEVELIVIKWKYYLDKLIGLKSRKLDQSQLPNLLQLTTNAWNQINKKILPTEIQNFAETIANNQDIPTKYLIETLPLPDELPINLILSISVINNNSGFSNSDFREEIRKIVSTAKESLRDFDTLGLIFVGTDGSRVCGNKGSFIGCASPAWDGWDRIINEIEIYDNGTSGYFKTNLQELQLTFEKITDIYPFIPNKNNINKVIVVNCNNFDDTIVENDSLIRRLSALDKLSITIIRIGNDNLTIKYIDELMTKPTNDMKITYGDNVVKFANVQNFIDTIPDLIENYQEITIPTLTIDLQGNVDNLEINGNMVETNNQSDIKLLIKDLIHQQPRKIGLTMTSGTITYTTKWLNHKIQKSLQV